MAVSANSFNAV